MRNAPSSMQQMIRRSPTRYFQNDPRSEPLSASPMLLSGNALFAGPPRRFANKLVDQAMLLLHFSRRMAYPCRSINRCSPRCKSSRSTRRSRMAKVLVLHAVSLRTEIQKSVKQEIQNCEQLLTRIREPRRERINRNTEKRKLTKPHTQKG